MNVTESTQDVDFDKTRDRRNRTMWDSPRMVEAIALQRSGKLEEAKTLFRQCQRENPTDPTLPFLLGTIAQTQGRFDEAVKCVQDAIALDPTFPPFYRQLAEIYRAQNLFVRAEEMYRNAIAADPTYAEARLDLGRFLFEQGRHREAIEQANTAFQADPTNERACVLMADAFRETDQIDTAERLYTIIRKRNPHSFEALAGVAKLDFVRGRFAEAEKQFCELLEEYPDNPAVENDLGCVLKDMGKVGEALAMFERASRHAPLSAEPIYNIGCVYRNQQQYAKAFHKVMLRQ